MAECTLAEVSDETGKTVSEYLYLSYAANKQCYSCLSTLVMKLVIPSRNDFTHVYYYYYYAIVCCSSYFSRSFSLLCGLPMCHVTR